MQPYQYRHNRLYMFEHQSQVLKNNPLGDPSLRRLPVWLPPGYEDDDKRYPVVWVLAPFTSWGEKLFNLVPWDENIIDRISRIVGVGDCPPAIFVFPDAFTRLGGSQYLNSSAVGDYEDYLMKELIPFVDANLRTIPAREHRGLLGYSSGGYAAFRLGILYPDVFGAIASHSGDINFELCYKPDFPKALLAIEGYGGVSEFLDTFDTMKARGSSWHTALNIIAMSACYSPDPLVSDGFNLPFDAYTGALRHDIWEHWLAKDPIRMAHKHLSELDKLNLLYFDCGRFDEFNLQLGARSLSQLLTEAEISHIYEEFDGGHMGIAWRYDVSLPLICEAISK